MATARQEKIAARARRDARADVMRLASLAAFVPLVAFARTIERGERAASTFALATRVARTTHAPGRVDVPWYRPGTV